jgi:hypothetical protein
LLASSAATWPASTGGVLPELELPSEPPASPEVTGPPLLDPPPLLLLDPPLELLLLDPPPELLLPVAPMPVAPPLELLDPAGAAGAGVLESLWSLGGGAAGSPPPSQPLHAAKAPTINDMTKALRALFMKDMMSCSSRKVPMNAHRACARGTVAHSVQMTPAWKRPWRGPQGAETRLGRPARVYLCEGFRDD